jgi:hypothetical protein
MPCPFVVDSIVAMWALEAARQGSPEMAEWMNGPAEPLVAGTQSVEKRLPNDLLVTVTRPA